MQLSQILKGRRGIVLDHVAGRFAEGVIESVDLVHGCVWVLRDDDTATSFDLRPGVVVRVYS